MSFKPVKPLTLGNRLALTEYDIVFDDGTEQAVMGILPVLGNVAVEAATSLAYDLSISAKMLADDHPRLRRPLRWLTRVLRRYAL